MKNQTEKIRFEDWIFFSYFSTSLVLIYMSICAYQLHDFDLMLGTNDTMYKGGKMCALCMKEEELVDHLFVHCAMASMVWASFSLIL